MWWKKKKDDNVDPEEDFAWIEEYIAKQMAKDPRVRLKEYMTDMTKAIEHFQTGKGTRNCDSKDEMAESFWF